MSNSLRPHGLKHTSLLCPYDSPGKNTGVGSHSLLQGIFPTGDQTHISCTAGRFFTTEPGGCKCLNIMLIHNLVSGRECFTQKSITFAVSLQILKTEKLVMTVTQWENTSLKHYLIILECFKGNRKDSGCFMCWLLLATFNNLYKRGGVKDNKDLLYSTWTPVNVINTHGNPGGRRAWGRMDTWACVAESLLLFTWNYHNILSWLDPNTKQKV